MVFQLFQLLIYLLLRHNNRSFRFSVKKYLMFSEKPAGQKISGMTVLGVLYPNHKLRSFCYLMRYLINKKKLICLIIKL